MFIILAISACEMGQKRYTQTSAEIDSYKQAIADYESGDWEGYQSHFADTAVIFHNTVNDSVSPAQAAEGMKESLTQFSSYEFVDDEGDMEMVITDKEQTWVNFWGTWKGTLSANGKELTIPVHTTAQFVDGKIVKEYGYWDTAPIMEAMMEIEAAAAAAEEGEEEASEE